MDFRPGVIVVGKYRVERLLGAGSASEVWEAVNIGIGARVALKKLKTASSRELTIRFHREAVMLARIRSDHVARVVDFVDDEAFGYVLVLDLIEGEALTETLKYKRLSVEEAIGLGIDVLSGVADLHEARIVHRDMKPSNVIEQVFTDGTRRAVIVDFGVSRLMASDGEGAEEDPTNITQGPMRIGTIVYMAPEQLIDSSSVGPPADLYAVGTILFRAVAGKTPFAGLSDVALATIKRLDEAPRLDTGRTDPRARAFEALVAKSLRRRIPDRYLTAGEMLAELRAMRDMDGESALFRTVVQDFDTESGRQTQPRMEIPPEIVQAYGHPRSGPAVAVGPSGTVRPPPGAPDLGNPTPPGSVLVPTTERMPHVFAATRKSSRKSAIVGGAIVVALGIGLALGRLTGSRPGRDDKSVASAAAAVETSAAPSASAAPTEAPVASSAAAAPEPPEVPETASPAESSSPIASAPSAPRAAPSAPAVARPPQASPAFRPAVPVASSRGPLPSTPSEPPAVAPTSPAPPAHAPSAPHAPAPPPPAPPADDPYR